MDGDLIRAARAYSKIRQSDLAHQIGKGQAWISQAENHVFELDPQDETQMAAVVGPLLKKLMDRCKAELAHIEQVTRGT